MARGDSSNPHLMGMPAERGSLGSMANGNADGNSNGNNKSRDLSPADESSHIGSPYKQSKDKASSKEKNLNGERFQSKDKSVISQTGTHVSL